MTTELFIENENANLTRAAERSRQTSLFVQIADACSPRRLMRITFRLPRRESCVTRRAMLAALREAELSHWMATGGDFLASENSNACQQH